MLSELASLSRPYAELTGKKVRGKGKGEKFPRGFLTTSGFAGRLPEAG
jgi:hypothetical protein